MDVADDARQTPGVLPGELRRFQDGAMVCVEEGYYYKQRDAKWQAPCYKATPPGVQVLGAWGDNLIGDARLKVGSPIRVELVLWDSSGVSDGQLGYKVIKLEPSELDRFSDYGHLAAGTEGPWSSTPMALGAIVHDPAARSRSSGSSAELPYPPRCTTESPAARSTRLARSCRIQPACDDGGHLPHHLQIAKCPTLRVRRTPGLLHRQ